MTRDARRRWVRGLLALQLICASPALAQTSLQIPLQFDFLNPGAKSKAMGGAFVAVADDATATFANPAGLILIPAPEVSFEFRAQRVETPFLERGRLSGQVFNEGTDTIAGPAFGTSIGTPKGIGYVSAVFPYRGMWTIAAYRHELVRVDQEFLSNGVFQQFATEFTSRRDSPQEGIRNVDITSYGVGGSYKLGEWAVGASLSLSSFEIDSRFRRFDIVGFLGPPNLNVEVGRSTQQGDGFSASPSVGLMYGLSGTVRAGVVYRHGPSFSFSTQDGNDPLRESTFRVPHALAGGVSWRPRLFELPAGTQSQRLGNPLTMSFELTHLRYARVREDFVTDQAVATGRQDDFYVDNGTELHLGVQYYPTTAYGAPKLRGGFWFDPDHSVQFRPIRPAVGVIDTLFDERLAAALSQGEGLAHYTGGVGFSLSSRLEVNGAVDVSSRARTISISAIVR